VLNPAFTKEMISQLDISGKSCRAYDGTSYHPGLVGLNNIKANDYCNVILQASEPTDVIWLAKVLTSKVNDLIPGEWPNLSS